MVEGRWSLLFVPVSGAGGAGEFFRCRAIAAAVLSRWPEAHVEFVLNRASRYAHSCPYPVHLLDESPTHATRAVNEVVARLRPSVVVFDSSGRVAQYRAAKRIGSKVIYISSRPRTRWKGFRLRRMRWLDQHWLIQPPFEVPPLSRWESLKLAVMRRPELVSMPTLFEPFSPEVAAEVLQAHELVSGEYVLVCPGGAGQFADAANALEEFAGAARTIAEHSGLRVVYVGQGAPPGAPSRLTHVTSLPNAQLMALIAHARLAVLNGGSLLLQSLAQGTAAVAAPIALDQPARIDGCARMGVVRAVQLKGSDLAAAALDVLNAPEDLARMRARIRELGITNGASTAIEALTRLRR